MTKRTEEKIVSDLAKHAANRTKQINEYEVKETVKDLKKLGLSKKEAEEVIKLRNKIKLDVEVSPKSKNKKDNYQYDVILNNLIFAKKQIEAAIDERVKELSEAYTEIN